ncbi:VOC family protein [Xanthomonas sp. CFBP 8703]|uniref:VOC family protein n=2 Tax=Xanthomonas bonasiae TaxID=2810351 RepID=A0ABS3B760_9XANT|nr:VOC family protein [Xanthomonas surreyensis]MBN6104397.1 VOC family protein [Xanthomonas bonasiae]MBN6112561.1 VOC family protein [Xanthomonas bonasiae]NYF20059.1 putative enzyme related to lactoylglutathione lyase [Xanthomonas sp. JAI131]
MKTHALTIDTIDPQALAAWWSQALGVAIGTDHGVLVTLDTPPHLLPLQFFKTERATTGRNRVHPDFRTPDLDKETERLSALGASVVQKYELPQIRFTTLADPEGNTFDLIQE